MKKAISLLLTLILCLSLCACGDTAKMTKEDMLAVAEEVNAKQINDDYDNQARAKQLYCGKTLKITGKVEEIHEDYILLGGATENYCPAVWVYLSTDDLVLLEQGQQITIVGQTETELRKAADFWAMLGAESDFLEMKQAYLVETVFEVTGTYFGPNIYFPPAINLIVNEGQVANLVYFVELDDLVGVEHNQIITVSGKIVYDNMGYDILDATLVE